jgi:hypothetical protein
MLVDDLHQAIVVLVKTIDDVGVELGVGERLVNGGKRVSESLDLVVEHRCRRVKLFTLTKLTTKSTAANLRLRSEGALQDGPGLMRGLREDQHPGHLWSERALDGREVGLVLPHPDAMHRIVNRTVHIVNDHRRTGKSVVHIAHQVVAPKKRSNLRMPDTSKTYLLSRTLLLLFLL